MVDWDEHKLERDFDTAGPSVLERPDAPGLPTPYPEPERPDELNRELTEFGFKARSQPRMVAGRFLHHKLAMLSLIVLVLFTLLAMLTPRFYPHAYTELSDDLSQAPSTNHWFGTPEIPGGFTPLSRVPSSRFGAVALTEGILFRKNLEPFRITGNVFYSHNFPGSGSQPGVTVYGGDLISTHLALEHVLDERTGFGYLVEMTTLQQFASRLDGHPVNTTPASFWLVGLQPGLEYTFSRYKSGAKLVGAIGVMFTVAGQDDIRAIYPNISFKYFFEQN